MAGLIERACAAQIKATQLTAGQLHKRRVLLQVIAEHRHRFCCIGSFMAHAERIAPA